MGMPVELGNDFFTPSVEWCQKAFARFERREGLAPAGRVEAEVGAIQRDVALRLWRFLATMARRAATLGDTALRLASRGRFEDDVAFAIGERLGLQEPEDRDLLDRLAAELHAWFAANNQGEYETPWRILRATKNEDVEVVPLMSAGRLPASVNRSPAAVWETRTPRPVAAPFAAGDRTQDFQKQPEKDVSPLKLG